MTRTLHETGKIMLAGMEQSLIKAAINASNQSLKYLQNQALEHFFTIICEPA